MVRALLSAFAHSHRLFQHTLHSCIQTASPIRVPLLKADPGERALLRSEKTLHEQRMKGGSLILLDVVMSGSAVVRTFS